MGDFHDPAHIILFFDLLDFRMSSLSWADIRHSDLPKPGEDVDYTAWILEHADESMLLAGVLDIPVLSPEGCEALVSITRTILGLGGDAVGSMHRYGTDLAAADVHAGFPFLKPILRDLTVTLEPIALAALILSSNQYSKAPACGEPATSFILHSSHAIGYGLEVCAFS